MQLGFNRILLNIIGILFSIKTLQYVANQACYSIDAAAANTKVKTNQKPFGIIGTQYILSAYLKQFFSCVRVRRNFCPNKNINEFKKRRKRSSPFSGSSITKSQVLEARDYYYRSLALTVFLRPLLICRLTVLGSALR